MAEQITGFEALEALNELLGEYGQYYLRYSYEQMDETHRHYSVAYGNEGVPNPQLSIEQRFFGDMHGKIRSQVGVVAGSVDRSALSPEIQALWDELDKTQAEYVKHIKVLEGLVEEHNKKPGAKKYIYTSATQLVEAAMKIDKDVAKRESSALAPLTVKYGSVGNNFILELRYFPTVPLRFATSPDKQKPESYVTAEISNDNDLLATMVVDGMIKDGQFRQLVHPVDLRTPVGASGHIQLMRERLFDALENTPEASAFREALSQKLLQDVTSYVERLDKKYGVELHQENPKIYEDFSKLRGSLGLDAGRGFHEVKEESAALSDGCGEAPEPTIATEGLAHQKASGDISKCPYHALKAKFSGFLNRGQKDMGSPGIV